MDTDEDELALDDLQLEAVRKHLQEAGAVQCLVRHMKQLLDEIHKHHEWGTPVESDLRGYWGAVMDHLHPNYGYIKYLSPPDGPRMQYADHPLVDPDPHRTIGFREGNPLCDHQWEAPGSWHAHECNYGRGHLAGHHCPCGATDA